MNIPEIFPNQIGEVLDAYNVLGRNAFFHGAPGVGKSAIIRQWAEAKAKKHNLTFRQADDSQPISDPDNTFGFIDLRLSTVDPLDFKGAPMLNAEERFTEYLKSSILPDAKRHGKFGLFFMDELPEALGMTLAAASQLILDKRIGNSYIFPTNWMIVAAGNRKEDNASAKKLPSQIAGRFGHWTVMPSVPALAKYLLSKGSDGRIGGLLRLRPELVHQRGRDDVAYPSPRAWESVDLVLQQNIQDRDMRENMVASFIGNGPASEVEGFLAMCTQLTSWGQIKENPMTARIPEPGTEQCVAAQFALIGMIVNNVTTDSIGPAIEYVERMPEEFGQFFILDLQTKNPSLMDTSAVSGWRARHNDVAV